MLAGRWCAVLLGREFPFGGFAGGRDVYGGAGEIALCKLLDGEFDGGLLGLAQCAGHEVEQLKVAVTDANGARCTPNWRGLGQHGASEAETVDLRRSSKQQVLGWVGLKSLFSQGSALWKSRVSSSEETGLGRPTQTPTDPAATIVAEVGPLQAR